MVSIATAMMASELGSGGCGQAASAIGACFLVNLYNGGGGGNRDHKCPSQGMEAQRSPFPGDSLFLFETELMWDTKPPCQPFDFCPSVTLAKLPLLLCWNGAMASGTPHSHMSISGAILG